MIQRDKAAMTAHPDSRDHRYSIIIWDGDFGEEVASSSNKKHALKRACEIARQGCFTVYSWKMREAERSTIVVYDNLKSEEMRVLVFTKRFLNTLVK